MITTSRYASIETRNKTKEIAKKKGILYLARGKKTIDTLATYARRKGFSTIYIAYKNRTSKLSIKEDGSWSWSSKESKKDET